MGMGGVQIIYMKGVIKMEWRERRKQKEGLKSIHGKEALRQQTANGSYLQAETIAEQSQEVKDQAMHEVKMLQVRQVKCEEA